MTSVHIHTAGLAEATKRATSADRPKRRPAPGSLLPWPLRPVLDLSTGHLTPATRTLLTDSSLEDFPSAGGPTQRGWLIYCCEDESPLIPDDLFACMKAGRDMGADYLLFDGDGHELPGLPTYDEETGEALPGDADAPNYSHDALALIGAAMAALRTARDNLKAAGAPRAAERVRLAITSTAGAQRHAVGARHRGGYQPRAGGPVTDPPRQGGGGQKP